MADESPKPKPFLQYMNERSTVHMELIIQELIDAIDAGLITQHPRKEFEDACEEFAAAALIVGVNEDLIDQLAARTVRGRAMLRRIRH